MNGITTQRHEKNLAELPCYSDLADFLDSLKKVVPGSLQHNVSNLEFLLGQAGKLVTAERDYEKDDAKEQIENLLR